MPLPEYNEYRAIQETIAKACGWEFSMRTPTRHGRPLPWQIPYCRHAVHTKGHWKKIGRLPAYPVSLDAMQQAIQSLDGRQLRRFLSVLKQLTPAETSPVVTDAGLRARAFIVALGLEQVAQTPAQFA